MAYSMNPFHDRLTKPNYPNKITNPLHKFASYNCLFTLSGLTEAEIRDPKKYLTGRVHDVIARSGGIGTDTIFENADNPLSTIAEETVLGESVADREGKQLRNKKYLDSIKLSKDILKRGHDIFFENVNIVSTVGPNMERGLANFTKMEFELAEPFSITFIEKVRAATFNSGYIDYQSSPLLLTIEWKGFDEHGNSSPREGDALIRKIPIIISRVEFNANQGGATYQVVAVPYTDFAFDDSYKFTRTKIPINAKNLNDWIFSVKKGLKKQMDDEVKENRREFHDEYEFQIDADVRKYGKDLLMVFESTSSNISVAEAHAKEEKEKADAYLGLGEDGGMSSWAVTSSKASISKAVQADIGINTNLVKAFEDVIRGQLGYQALVTNFWLTYFKLSNETYTKDDVKEILTNKKHKDKLQSQLINNQFVPWFKITSTVHTNTEEIDKFTKMHPKKIIYRAEFYKIHVLKLIESGLSLGQVDWSDYVRKEYNYIYTGDNVDVQDLKINYKTAYYMRNVRSVRAPGEKNLPNVPDLLKEALTVFGKEKEPPEPLLPLRQYPSILKGKGTANLSIPMAKAQEFYDYLVNPEADMIKIELQILGDPAFVAQDMYTTLSDKEKDNSTSEKAKMFGIRKDYDAEKYKSFNVDQYMPIIKLNYRLPTDIDEQTGTMFTDRNTLDDNLWFGGLYQVVRVDNRMESGQFTQVLTCVRMNNQQSQSGGVLVEAVKTSTHKFQKDLDKKRKEKKGRMKELFLIKFHHKDFNNGI